MKKLFIVMFSLFLIISLSSCDSSKDADTNNNTEEKQEIKIDQETSTWTLETNDWTWETNTWVTNSWSVEKSGSWEKIEEEAIEEMKKNNEIKKELPKTVSQKTMLIFDASWSMWWKINWKTKIEIAREVIKNTLDNFKDSELGLMAYWHREKGNCKDIEILLEPSKDNWDKISNFVDSIIPKWMTPMWDSVMMAAENLKYTEEKATIILVTDGKETCWVDLCALGKKLEESWADFTAHVIGFDISEKDSAWLKCLASETGWKFMLAKDADSLSDALWKAVEASSCSVEKLGESVITAPETVSAWSEFEIEYTWPLNGSDNISIVPRGSIDNNAHLDYIYLNNGETKVEAPNNPGEYDLVYFANCGTVLWRTPIEVVDTVASITAAETVYAWSELEISYTWPKNASDVISVLPRWSLDYNSHFDYIYAQNNETSITAPNEIWEYDLVYYLNSKKEIARTPFKVIEVTASFTVPTTVTAGEKFNFSYTWPKNRSDAILVLPKGSSNRNDHLDLVYAKNNEKDIMAPKETWEYDLVYFLNGKKILARASFTVTK